MPIFEIIASQSLDEQGESQFYSNNNIEISNEGGPVHDFQSSVANFIEITYLDPEKGYAQRVIRYPLNGYFGASFLSGSSKGTLVTLAGYKNNLKIFQLSKSLSEYSEKTDISANLEVKTYLKLNYKDFLNREHEEYYFVPHIGTKKLSVSEGVEIFKEFNETPLSSVQTLGRLNIDTLITLINQDMLNR